MKEVPFDLLKGKHVLFENQEDADRLARRLVAEGYEVRIAKIPLIKSHVESGSEGDTNYDRWVAKSIYGLRVVIDKKGD